MDSPTVCKIINCDKWTEEKWKSDKYMRATAATGIRLLYDQKNDTLWLWRKVFREEGTMAQSFENQKQLIVAGPGKRARGEGTEAYTKIQGWE